MPVKISSSEVLSYLNHLGYTNINAQQLKEFIQDLKKLIKYEERKRREEKADVTPDEPGVCTDEYADIFISLYEHGTVASKAKVIAKKESTISVQVRKDKRQTCLEHDEKNVALKTNRTDLTSKSECSKDELSKNNRLDDKVQSTRSQENETGARAELKKFNIKPKTSFIRPIVPVINKSDPVTLYHQYQAEWKRHKLPGEDRRTDLRWAIREKMLSGPKVS